MSEQCVLALNAPVWKEWTREIKDLLHGHVRVQALIFANVCGIAAHLNRSGVIANGDASQERFPSSGMDQADQNLDERRFATTVWSEESGDSTLVRAGNSEVIEGHRAVVLFLQPASSMITEMPPPVSA